ncbi:MAG: TldD/PmbA family protein, partial [Propionibacteriaceae bacterium]
MTAVAQWIEQTLALASAPACSVIVHETHQLNLRWALNALTTNGIMMERTATVIVYDADRAASASGSLTEADDLVGLLHEAQRALPQAPHASDAAPLQAGGVAADFADPAESVELAAFARVTQDLGQACADARRHDRVLFGFAELHRQTQWLATSAGTRQRYVQPMGRCEFTAKSLDFVNSAWVGQETRDFTDVDITAHYAELVRRLGWGENRITLEPGQYETILSPGA